MLNLSDSNKTSVSCEHKQGWLSILRLLREKNERHARVSVNLNVWSQRHKEKHLWGKEVWENWGLWGFFHWHLARGHPFSVRRSKRVQVNQGLVSKLTQHVASSGLSSASLGCKGESGLPLWWVWFSTWLYPEEKYRLHEESKLRICLKTCLELFLLQIMLCCYF